MPFSEGFGGTIYLGWPVAGGDISWQLLGFISNEKPSAIFKIAKVKPQNFGSGATAFGLQGMDTTDIAVSTALVGVVVETMETIAQQTPSANTDASTVDSMTEFSQKMLENFFNFASSFAVNPAQSPLNPAEGYIPARVLQQWYETFQRRLQTNPSFWKTL